MGPWFAKLDARLMSFDRRKTDGDRATGVAAKKRGNNNVRLREYRNWKRFIWESAADIVLSKKLLHTQLFSTSK